MNPRPTLIIAKLMRAHWEVFLTLRSKEETHPLNFGRAQVLDGDLVKLSRLLHLALAGFGHSGFQLGLTQNPHRDRRKTSFVKE